jgi:L-asparagine transporter-like permease
VLDLKFFNDIIVTTLLSLLLTGRVLILANFSEHEKFAKFSTHENLFNNFFSPPKAGSFSSKGVCGFFLHEQSLKVTTKQLKTIDGSIS